MSLIYIVKMQDWPYHFLQGSSFRKILNSLGAVFATLSTVRQNQSNRYTYTSLTHSVNSRPGNTALIRTLGPWVTARHFINCRPWKEFVNYRLNPIGHRHPTGSLCDRVRHRAPTWDYPLYEGYLKKAQNGDLDKLTAMEEVMRKAPPSGLALNVGKASRSKCRFPLTFTAQHFSYPVRCRPPSSLTESYFIPFFFGQCIKIAEY